MQLRLGGTVQRQRDPPRQQRGLRRRRRAEGGQPPGQSRRVGHHPAVARPRGEPGLGQHQPGVRLPPRPPLPGEQPHRRGRPVHRRVRVARRPGRLRRRQQQFRLAGALPAHPVERRDRRVRLGQRLRGQPGRPQHLAAADAQHERRGAQRGVPLGGLVEEPQRRRDVTGAERGQRPPLDHVRLVMVLAGRPPQLLGRREVRLRPVHRAHRQVHGGPQGQRPRHPDHVPRLPQHRDRPADVVQRLAVTAQHPERVRPAVQHPGPGVRRAAAHPPLERGQPLPGPPRVHQGHPERGQHVGLPVGRTRPRRQVPGAPQMAQRQAQVTEVPLPDAYHLMGHRRVLRGRTGLEEPLRPAEGHGRCGEDHRQQFEDGSASRCHPPHGSSPGQGFHQGRRVKALYRNPVRRIKTRAADSP